jgi:hypothetical protein
MPPRAKIQKYISLDAAKWIFVTRHSCFGSPGISGDGLSVVTHFDSKSALSITKNA